VTYALGTVGGASGLVDTATGESVNLSLGVGGVVEGRTATSNHLVFTVNVNSTSGAVTLDQIRAVVHPTTTDPNDAKSLSADNLVKLSATITDNDGETQRATLDIGWNLVFLDDGPSIIVNATTEPVLSVDETVLATNATVDFSGNFSSAFGADGAGTVSYALGVVVGASGLIDTATGEAVNLSLSGGVVEGASTITMQLVKNIFLSHQRTVSRKLAEAVLAVRVEQVFSKNDILEMYLNNIYWGHNNYGVQTAARSYFNKSAEYVNCCLSKFKLLLIPKNLTLITPLISIFIGFLLITSIKKGRIATLLSCKLIVPD
jgi:hypothetical protein